MNIRIRATDLSVEHGDITTQHVDAIVNAANSALAIGGGVDGAIHRAGGPAIHAEIRERYPNGCPTGSAVITGAGNLPAKWVIHAVGPVWNGGNSGEAEHLAGAYRRALELADEAGAKSIAFPAISTGVYGYPIEQAAKVAVSTVAGYLEQHNSKLDSIYFVVFGQPAFEAYSAFLSRPVDET